MKSDTFTVSKQGRPKLTVTFDKRPETLEEFQGIVSKYPEDVIDLAYQNFVIKAQAGARNRYDEGEEAVQKYINEYVYGARTGGGGARRVTLAADQIEAGGFSEDQLAMLRAAGVVIPGLDNDEPEEGDEELDKEFGEELEELEVE